MADRMKTVKAWAISVNGAISWNYPIATRRYQRATLDVCFTEEFRKQNDVRIVRVEIREIPTKQK